MNMRERRSVMLRVTHGAFWTLALVTWLRVVHGSYGSFAGSADGGPAFGYASYETWLRSSESHAPSNQTNSPANPYFTNDTLLGQPVECTEAEKRCFRYNRILSRARRICYPLGDGPRHCPFAVDRYVFETTGHLVGTCDTRHTCEGASRQKIYRMAFDGTCVKQINLNLVCGSGPVNVIQHFFGDSECVSVNTISQPEPVYIAQPHEARKCVFPNLRHDLTSVSNQESRVLYKECSPDQGECFIQNKVFCKDIRRCCDLFQQGHCPEGEWVTLNRTAWNAGTVDAGCARKCPCDSNGRIMAFDSQCHSRTEILEVLCPGGVLLPNVFGEMSCVTRDFYKHYAQLGYTINNSCEIMHKLSYDTLTNAILLKTDCGLKNDENCINSFQ